MLRYIKHSVILLTLSFLASCTLSMDEWIAPQEEKGYETAEVVKNEFYDLTYKFKPSTRSLTDNIREYIANVENDSVLYFMDSLPEDWMPHSGGCVVSECCEMFPMGLLRKVDFIDHVDGMYKVVTSEANIDEAYEEFEFDLDTDILFSSLDENGENENVTRMANKSVTRGNDEPDSVIVDWKMYNRMSKKHKMKNKNGVATRAFEDDYDEDVDKDSVDIMENQLLTFSSSSEIGKMLMEKIKVINQAELTLYDMKKINVRKIVSLKNKRDYSKQIIWDGWRINLTIGYDLIDGVKYAKDKKKDPEEYKKQWDAVKKWRKELYNKGVSDISYSQKLPSNNKLQKGFVRCIPFGAGCPFGFLIRLKPIYEIDLGLYGSGDFTYWSNKSVVISDAVNGKEVVNKKYTYKDYKTCPESDKSMVKKLSVPDYEFKASIFGKFHASGGFEFFAGVGRSIGGEAIGLGAFCRGNINFDIKIGGDFNNAADGWEMSSKDIVSVDLTCDIGVKAIAGSWIDHDFGYTTYTIPLGDVKYFPTLSAAEYVKRLTAKDNSGKEYTQFTFKYKLKDMGFLGTIMSSKYAPRIKVYKNTGYSDMSSGELLAPDNNPSKIAKDTEYKFTYKTYDTQAEFTIVPCLEELSSSELHYFMDNTVDLTIDTEPIVRYITELDYKGSDMFNHWYLLKAEEMTANSDLASKVDDPSKYIEFQYAMPFELYNAYSMSKSFKDFGISYHIAYRGETLFSEDKSLISKCQKSGIYKPIIKFAVEKKNRSMETIRKNIYIWGEGYYVSFEDDKRHSMVGTDKAQYRYTYYTYNYSKNANNTTNLNTSYYPEGWGDFSSQYDWFNKGTSLPITARAK